MPCEVCAHRLRADIENALLNMNSDNKHLTLKVIAEEYSVSVDSLKVHALMHAPVIIDRKDEELVAAPSIARQLKTREADMLISVAQEYIISLKAMGEKINSLVTDPCATDIDGKIKDTDLRLAKLLTKPMVDLYLGLGGEVRATVKAISELDHAINGDSSDALTGLAALTEALKRSKSGGETRD